MNDADDLAYLRAQRAWIRQRIDRLGPEERLMRLNLESRLQVLDEEIAALDEEIAAHDAVEMLSPRAHVTLTFGGEPVVESRAIQASFGAEAIQKFQQLVSTTAATLGGRELSMRGRIPDEESSRLFITGVVPGSFGFELEEVTTDPQQEPGALREAVDEAGRLLQATQMGEDAFADAVSQSNPRVVKALAEFLRVTASASATLRISTGATECSFETPAAVAAAAERARMTKLSEAEERVTGVLTGVLAATRRFEFRREGTDEIIHGRIPLNIEDPFTLAPYMGKRCVAQIWALILERAGKEQRTYYLAHVEPAPEEDGAGPR